jgi:hypothetical protein
MQQKDTQYCDMWGRTKASARPDMVGLGEVTYGLASIVYYRASLPQYFHNLQPSAIIATAV